MQQYELTLIFSPDLTEEKADAIIDQLKLKILERQVWGKRMLAYPVKKQKEGLYVHLVISAQPEDIAKTERAIQLNDKILRHLLVKAEKEVENS